MKPILLTLLIFTFSPLAYGVEPDILIADFEGDTYGDWKTTGEAFGPGPARGTLPNQMHVDGFKGKGLVNSFYNGDTSTGTLTSPEFKIERKFITFLIGGGKDTEKTCMNLLVAGKIVRKATGLNDKPGGTETLAPDSWDVAEFAGKNAVIQIVDQAKGGWGHINVDHIVQSDRKAAAWLTDAKRDFIIEKRYLSLPIKNGAPKRKVTTLVDGKVEVRNDIELANDEPDWWAFVDVRAWQGKTITIQVDKLAEDSKALSAIEQSDSFKDENNLYHEPLRGQFHFSTRRGWINDPNGMVYFNNEYHLFYQHNPYGWGWGNMHWGHAVSRDMVHWQDLGDTLAPDNFGPMFSGSAVVDWKNTSGLSEGGRPPLVLIYTAAGNPTVQCIASSTDGRNFTKYTGNPVLKQITGGNRDPKVFWHEATKKWVMVLYVELKNSHTIHFFTSDNLRDWTFASTTPGGAPGKSGYLFECPEFFELPIDGDASKKKWVLMAANSEYAVGTFDGTSFKTEQTHIPGHRGRGYYAAQTFSDIPAKDGRRIMIGWLQTATAGMPFNQAMSLPMELKLSQSTDGLRLLWLPIKELESLRSKSHRLEALTLKEGEPNPLAKLGSELVEIRAQFEPGDTTEVAFKVRGISIVYDAKTKQIIVNNHRAPAPLNQGKLSLMIYVDRTACEVFASDGLTYVPMPVIPRESLNSIAVAVKGGAVRFTELEVHELKSSWQK